MRRACRTIFCATALAACPAPILAASFSVMWEAPGDPDVVAYRVYRAASAAGPYEYLKRVTVTKAGVEVPSNTTACYRVTAVDSLGQASPMSGRVCISVTTETGE